MSDKQLSYRIANFAKKMGRDPTGAELRCVDMVLAGISPGVKEAIEAELVGDVDTLAKCSARELMDAHVSLKHLQEATGLPLLQGEVVLNGYLKDRLEKLILPYVNRDIEDEDRLLQELYDVIDDDLFLLGLRHMKPRVWLEGDELRVEIMLKEKEDAN